MADDAPDAAPRAWDPSVLAGVTTTLPDGVVILGADGAVAWANPAAHRILARAPGDLVGRDGLALLHPDELERALAGIELSVAFPDRTAVVPFRVADGAGGWVDVELKSGLLPGVDGSPDQLVLVLRDAAPRARVAETLATVAGGAPVAASARGIAATFVARWPGVGAAVVFDPDDAHVTSGPHGLGDADGPGAAERRPRAADGSPGPTDGGVAGRHVEAVGLPDTLVAPLTDTDPTTPWARAAATGELILAVDAELGALEPAATAAGFRACAAVPVPDPTGAPAVIVAWFDEPLVPRLEFRHAAVELVELLLLALDRRAHLRRLWAAAREDPLTGLTNRTGFFERLASSAGHEAGSDPTRQALLYLDLDGFKPVNDRFGHLVGDAVLVTVAARLRATVRPTDALARLGGDEFAVLARFPAEGSDASVAATELAGRLIRAISEPITVTVAGTDVGPLRLGASVGVAVTGRSGTDDETAPEDLLARADAAMYEAKAAGRGRLRVAEP